MTSRLSTPNTCTALAKHRLFVGIAFLLMLLTGCSMVQDLFQSMSRPASKPKSRMRESALERIAPTVRQELDSVAREAYATATTGKEPGGRVPARFQRRLIINGLTQPWQGIESMEGQGLLVAELAEGGSVNLPGLLDVLEAGVDRTSVFHEAVPFPTRASSRELATFMLGSLEEASRLREKAVANLTEEERHFVFNHSETIVTQFSPQVSTFSDQNVKRLQANLRYGELLEQQVDYANLIAAAQVLARLANEQWLRQLAAGFSESATPSNSTPGTTGTILYAEDTSYGLIVVGGTGPNTYELDNRFALLIDLGGDDHYRGMIASSSDEDHGNAVVLDLAGNDTYDGSALGLATGRLGVGLLIDESGDDVYKLDMGSGGTGFGGLGILLDGEGNDVYDGGRLTQGAAIGGLGLLFDAAGNDRYTSHGFAIGFGGPQGIGAVIDVQGNDRYQCGDKYPSAYNEEDAPNGKPGDPLFQYDCFGLGTGSGQRILSNRPEWQVYNLAGGWGLLLDIAGHDYYRGANFSQGHGYFFGIGTIFDLDGDDEYAAARYGHGSSAHFGLSLFNDRHGDDRYTSSGPYYNGGVAWDHSVSLMLDSGAGKDQYAFEQSTGLGGADYAGWGLFIDEGGNDKYRVKSGFGHASEKGLAGFFDLNGQDQYEIMAEPAVKNEERPANLKKIRYSSGGLFVDR